MRARTKRPRRKSARPVGRPKKPITAKAVFELARIDCSYAEMAAVLGCDQATLTRNFAQAIQRGRKDGRKSLKRAQFIKAVDGGNPQMLIWLGKVRLGQKDPNAPSASVEVKTTDEKAGTQTVFNVEFGDGKPAGE
jgi:hypothetical protein